jgi:hypothetical protein
VTIRRAFMRSASLAAAAVLALPLVASAQLVPCEAPADAAAIASALAVIERSVDPCGESADLVATVERVRRCAAARYQICTSVGAGRNLFDRPARFRISGRRTITWNPGLRSELDPDRHDGGGEPMLRDPTASLVHELAHAAQDCAGLNPGEHEFEAVRIENIYRRAASLPQRRGYGPDPLPPAMVRTCTSTACTCERPDGALQARASEQSGGNVGGSIESSGDSAPPARAPDAEHAFPGSDYTRGVRPSPFAPSTTVSVHASGAGMPLARLRGERRR